MCFLRTPRAVGSEKNALRAVLADDRQQPLRRKPVRRQQRKVEIDRQTRQFRLHSIPHFHGAEVRQNQLQLRKASVKRRQPRRIGMPRRFEHHVAAGMCDYK